MTASSYSCGEPIEDKICICVCGYLFKLKFIVIKCYTSTNRYIAYIFNQLDALCDQICQRYKHFNLSVFLLYSFNGTSDEYYSRLIAILVIVNCIVVIRATILVFWGIPEAWRTIPRDIIYGNSFAIAVGIALIMSLNVHAAV